MNDLLKKMLDELDVQKSVEHIEWLTTNTPNRLSGGGQDLKVCQNIYARQWSLMVWNQTFWTSKHITVIGKI